MRALVFIGSALGALAVPAAVVHAEPRADADAHARRGVALYNLGKYEEAIDEFEDAYKEFQSDALLFNLAQAHRKLEHCDRALTYYHRFLAGSPAPALVEQVEKLLPELEAACRTRDARPDGPVATAAPETRQVASAPVPPAPAPDGESATESSDAEPAHKAAPSWRFGAGATVGELLSAGNAPVTGLRATATMDSPWGHSVELGFAAGAVRMWRADSGNDAMVAQLAALIEYRGAIGGERWTASGELGAEYISLLGSPGDAAPGVSRSAQWAPLAGVELGIEHDVLPDLVLRAAAAFAVCPPIGALDAAVGELDLVIGVRYAR